MLLQPPCSQQRALHANALAHADTLLMSHAEPKSRSLQAYGAGQYTHVGVVLQRALLICSIAMLGVLLLWTQLADLLLLAGDTLPSA